MEIKVRMIAPGRRGMAKSATAADDRAYADFKPDEMQAAADKGWEFFAFVGGSAARRFAAQFIKGDGAQLKLPRQLGFVDTDLGKMVVFDERRGAFFDPVTLERV
jgi:hypothetical protein